MHHRNGLMFRKDLIQPRAVQQIALLKGAEFHGIAPACHQIIECDGDKARRFQCLTSVRADIARSARYQYLFHFAFSRPYCAARSIWEILCR